MHSYNFQLIYLQSLIVSEYIYPFATEYSPSHIHLPLSQKLIIDKSLTPAGVQGRRRINNELRHLFLFVIGSLEWHTSFVNWLIRRRIDTGKCGWTVGCELIYHCN